MAIISRQSRRRIAILKGEEEKCRLEGGIPMEESQVRNTDCREIVDIKSRENVPSCIEVQRSVMSQYLEAITQYATKMTRKNVEPF
jgi:hypothetical protein